MANFYMMAQVTNIHLIQIDICIQLPLGLVVHIFQGQRFFAEKNWQGDFEEDTLSVTLAANGNFEFRESIWDWEVSTCSR